jgi:predicted nucleic acid-binding protein
MPRSTLFADASVLIGLSRIGRLDLILELPVDVLVVEAVWEEIAGPERDRGLGGVAALREARESQQLSVLSDGQAARFPDLDTGEASTLAAAMDRGAAVAVDERRARRAIARDPEASRRISAVTGTVTLVLLGKRRGALESAQDILDGLRNHGFRLSSSLYEQALRLAGEWPPQRSKR